MFFLIFSCAFIIFQREIERTKDRCQIQLMSFKILYDTDSTGEKSVRIRSNGHSVTSKNSVLDIMITSCMNKEDRELDDCKL